MSDLAINVRHARPDRGRDFRSATRHSRRVRLLRVLLPGSALATVAAFLVTAAMDIRELAEPEFDSGAVAVSGSTITMESPRLTGYNSENRPYEVIATRAEQDITKPDAIDLANLAAKLQLAGDGWTRLMADKGLFDNKKQTLVLTDAVKVASNTGYTANLRSANVDLRRGLVKSTEPVHVTMDSGELTADQMEIRQGGDIIVFYGQVRMTLQPRQFETSAPETAQ